MADDHEGITLSELLKGVTGSLNRLKEPLFSKEDLENKGIVTSFQNLPCTVDICYTKEGWFENKTTRIKSSLKQILTGVRSSQVDATNRESYLTYVEVSVEHHVIPSKSQGWVKRIVRMILIGVVVLAAVGGGSYLIKRCVAQKNGMVNSCFTVRQFDGTNQVKKVEMEMKCDEREW